MQAASFIRNIEDFPRKGVTYKDITPLLQNADAFKASIDYFVSLFKPLAPSAIVGIESRGLIFASSIAYALDCGMVMIRKSGKLPHDTYTQAYTLEYGQDELEIHQDALCSNDNIIVIDDVLATGGTMDAALRLLQKFEVKLSAIAFLIEISAMQGRKKLPDTHIYSQIVY